MILCDRTVEIDILNSKGQLAATLTVEGPFAVQKSGLEKHYTQFANMFMRHLGRDLTAIVRRTTP